MRVQKKKADELLGLHCKQCGQGFGVCRSCYHGQKYCGDGCRKAARREQCREAQQRYMAKRKRPLSAAKAAAAYRGRVKKGQKVVRAKIVIDQGLLIGVQKRDKEAAPTHCVRCGLRGRVLRWVN